MLNDETEAAIQATNEAVQDTAGAVVFGNIIFTIIFALSFKSMW